MKRSRHRTVCCGWILLLVSSLLFAFDRPGQNQPVSSNPELDLLMKRGESQVAQKLFDDAIDTYKKCLELSPRNPVLHNRLGVAYHRKQLLPLAKSNYEKAIKLDPSYAEAYNNLGTVYFNFQKYGRAVRYYNKALKLRPDIPTMHYNLGNAFFAQEKYPKAFAEFRTALTMDPELMQHISPTGTTLRTLGSKRWKYLFEIARIFAEMGKKDEALNYLTRAFEEGFEDVNSIYAEKAFAELVKDERFIRLAQNPPKKIY